MHEWNLAPELERAAATVAQWELRLRLAQDDVRRAGELLRRAIRAADNAAGERDDATRRLDRIEPPLSRAG